MSRYKTLLRSHPQLQALVSPEQLKQFNLNFSLDFRLGHGHRFELSEKPAVLILANRGYDFYRTKKNLAGNSACKNSKKKSAKAMTSTSYP